MPLYTYHCNKCGAEIDVRVTIANRDDPRLHTCGSIMTRKLSCVLASIVKQTGKEMATNILNSGEVSSRWTKGASRGLEKPPRRVW